MRILDASSMILAVVRDLPGRSDFMRVAEALETIPGVRVWTGVGPPERWDLYWGLHTDRGLEALDANQTVNALPGMGIVGDKPGLHRLLRRARYERGEHEQREVFSPESFLLPYESAAFEARRRVRPTELWAIKEPGTWSGRGVSIHAAHEVKYEDIAARPLVAQRYVVNPMLIDGRKFDARWWFLVTAVSPQAKGCLLDQGYLKIARRVYRPAHPWDRCSHITNNAVQSRCGDVASDVGGEEHEGVPFHTGDPRLPHEDATYVHVEARRVLSLYLARSAPDLQRSYTRRIRARCFQLLSADIVYEVDAQGRPRALLLEVNTNGYLGAGLMRIPGGRERLRDMFEIVMGRRECDAAPDAENGHQAHGSMGAWRALPVESALRGS